jgi:hypothetical protein
MSHLKGIDFPASKADILRMARGGEGPDTPKVLSVLQQIDDREYNSPAEIMKQIGSIE